MPLVTGPTYSVCPQWNKHMLLDANARDVNQGDVRYMAWLGWDEYFKHVLIDVECVIKYG